MKKMMILMMLAATLTACSSEDPFSDYNNSWASGGNNGGGMSGGTSTATGELTTFTVNIDKTTAEPSLPTRPMPTTLTLRTTSRSTRLRHRSASTCRTPQPRRRTV